jgi:hypothetical protein
MTDELLKYIREVSKTKVLKPFNAKEAILFTDMKKSYLVSANVGKMTLVQLVASNNYMVIQKGLSCSKCR